jgi:hypothetical protein
MKLVRGQEPSDRRKARRAAAAKRITLREKELSTSSAPDEEAPSASISPERIQRKIEGE